MKLFTYISCCVLSGIRRSHRTDFFLSLQPDRTGKTQRVCQVDLKPTQIEIFAVIIVCVDATLSRFKVPRSFFIGQVCVQLPTSADNVALPAFGRRCYSAPAVQQSSDIFCAPAHSSKRAAATCDRWLGQIDRQMDARQIHRPWSAYHAGRANRTPPLLFLPHTAAIKPSTT